MQFWAITSPSCRGLSKLTSRCLKGAAQPPTTLDDFLRFYLPELPAIDSIITPCHRNKMEYVFCGCGICFNKFCSLGKSLFTYIPIQYYCLIICSLGKSLLLTIKSQFSREAHIMTYKLPEIPYLDSNDGSNYPPVNQHRYREKNRV